MKRKIRLELLQGEDKEVEFKLILINSVRVDKNDEVCQSFLQALLLESSDI